MFRKCIENDSKVFVSLSVLKLFVRIELIAATRALGGLVFYCQQINGMELHGFISDSQLVAMSRKGLKKKQVCFRMLFRQFQVFICTFSFWKMNPADPPFQ